MIDTHIHIIPDVDDGAVNISMSIEMAKMAIADGVDEMIITPHYRVPMFVSENINRQYRLLQKKINEERLPIKVHIGNEIYVNEESIEGLKNGMARTMANSNYLLMELPFSGYYPVHENLLFGLQIYGYNIIIAHVERCRTFLMNTDKLEKFINKGFYGQLSAKYLMNIRTRKKGLNWIKAGFIHVIASDGHNLTSRQPILGEAYKIVEKKLGTSCAETLFIDNPRRILEDEPLIKPIIEGRKLFEFPKINKKKEDV